MASPKASGRMIRKSISDSDKFASLSPEAAVLFVMLIPHFNTHGKMFASPGHIKDEVCPLIPFLTYDNLAAYLQEISDKTSVKWFKVGTKWWLHSLNFLSEHQDLRNDRMGSDDLPSYPVEQSGSSPGVVPELPLRAEGFKGLREEENQENLKPKTTTVLTTELEIATGGAPLPDPEPSSSKMTINEFRFAFQEAAGTMMPGGCNAQASEWCMRFPRDKLEEAFRIMAMQGGKTVKYLGEVLSGKPKPVLGQKNKAEQQIDSNVAATQEALRLIREAKHGAGNQDSEGFVGTGNDDGDSFPGGPADWVPESAGRNPG